MLLVGMRIPLESGGNDYVDGFGGIYPRLAAEYRVPLVPFLLDGVARIAELNHRDGLHPNAAGHQRLAENVRPHLEQLLAELEPARR